MGYNAASPMVDGQTVIYAGSDRGTTAVKLEKKDDAYAAKDLWSNKDNSVIYSTPIFKNGMVFALSGKIHCSASTRTARLPGLIPSLGKGGKGRAGYGNIVDAGLVLMSITPSANLLVLSHPTRNSRRSRATRFPAAAERMPIPFCPETGSM